MAVKAVLLSILIVASLFAWRAWRQLPGLAVAAGAAAGVAAVVLARTPFVLLAGIGAAVLIGSYLARRGR